MCRESASLKISAIGQAIAQCSRPNSVIAPLQIGLGVHVHRSFGSRCLVDTLNRLGFCCSYSEVKKLEKLKRCCRLWYRPAFGGRRNQRAVHCRQRGSQRGNSRWATNISALQPSKLPPTSTAAKFHSMRCYYQVQEWLLLACSRSDFHLNPLEWGWEETDNMLLPVCCDEPAAPDELLNIIKCSCKTDCQTARCSCRQHGLVCGAGCSECRGETCTNSIQMVCYDDSDSSDDSDE